jgi:hypothetical protein
VAEPQSLRYERIPDQLVATMSATSVDINSETARIRAALVNSGRHSFEEADARLAASTVSIILGNAAATTQAGQAAFLTAVLTGARSFGRVLIDGAVDTTLMLALPVTANTLAGAAIYFGAQMEKSYGSDPCVFIGDLYDLPERDQGWSVQAYWDGWTAGTAPGNNPCSVGRSDCPLAGVAAGALAIGQAFLFVQGDLRAGRMRQTISVWSGQTSDTDKPEAGPGFDQILLPGALWLVGLGNLGQAYIWSLTVLPYAHPENVMLFLQDDQSVDRENWGTSVLVQRGKYGRLKTRLAEDWATARGFQVRRIDRRLDEHLIRSEQDPGIAIAGLDRMPPRRQIGRCGFEYIIDAGLGATASEYCKIRLNVFNAHENPDDHFKDVEDRTAHIAQGLMQLPAYQRLAMSRDDGGCGAATLAEASVAVPFVSAVAGALAITQAIRISCGYAHHRSITLDVGDAGSLRSTLGPNPNRLMVPGFTPVI